MQRNLRVPSSCLDIYISQCTSLDRHENDNFFLPKDLIKIMTDLEQYRDATLSYARINALV